MEMKTLEQLEIRARVNILLLLHVVSVDEAVVLSTAMFESIGSEEGFPSTATSVHLSNPRHFL